MNNQERTKEELINELQELQQAHNALKVSAEADIITQKQTMEALKASEERFQLLFNKAPLGYQSLDFDGNFIEVNQQWLDTLGYEREEVMGKWFGDFLAPAYKDGFRKRFPIFKERGKIRSEFEMIHKNGSVMFIAFDGRIGYDVKGDFKQTHCILQDVTEVRIAEKELLKSRELLKSMEKAAKIGGWEFDVETMVQTWTDEIFHILEIDTTHGAPAVPEGVGFIAPEFQPLALLGIQRAIEFGEPYNQEWEVITAKGNKRWVNAIATPYQENGITKSVSGSFQDITKRKYAEIALLESEENLSITLYSIGDGVISTDKNGLVIQMNPVAETLCGWKLIDALGKPLAEVFSIINAETRQTVADPVAKVFEKGEIVGLANHTILVSRNGTEYQISDSAAPIRNKAGEIRGVVLVFSDITGSYIAQKQIKDSEERYRNLIGNLEAGIVVYSSDTSITINNHRASELLGLTDDQMRGKAAIEPAWKFMHEDNTPLTLDEYPVNRILKGLKPIRNQVLGIQRPIKNDIVWVTVNGFPVLDTNGKIAEIVISFIDITERKNTEEKIRFQAHITANSPVITAYHDKELNMVWANNAYQKATGLSLEEIKGRKCYQVWNLTEPCKECPVIKAIETGENATFELTPHNQEHWPENQGYWHSQSTPVRDALGAVIGAIEFAIDITERKRAEELLQEKSEEIEVQNEELIQTNQELAEAKEKAEESEEKYRLAEIDLLEAQKLANIGSWHWDLKTGLVVWSKELYNINGHNPDIPVPVFVDMASYYTPESWEKINKAVARTFNTGEPYNLDFEMVKPDGTVIFTNTRGCANYDEAGEMVSLQGTVQDITERKKAEHELHIAMEIADVNNANITAIIEGTADSIWAFNEQFEIIYINQVFKQEFHQTFGIWLEPGINLVNSLPEAIRPLWQNRYERVLNNEQFTVEDAVDTVNGILYIQVTFNPIVKKGQVIGGSCFGSNITLRKLAEIELIKAKAHAEESAEQIKRQNQEILFINQRLESLLEISQLQTNSVQELLDFALKQAVDLTKSKIGYIYFYVEEKKQFILNSWSKEVMKECSVIDPQTIYDLDKTGCWGEAVRQRKPIIINDYQAESPIKKGTPEGHVKLEKFLTIPVIFDNKIVAVAGVANKSTDYNSSDIRQLTLLMDNVWKISERLVLIKDLLEAKEHAEESDRLKSAFLANMSHEIRTPMNGILGFAELLKEPGLTGDQQQEYIKIIEKSGTRMLNIINDIVDISKIESGLIKLDINESNINQQIEYIYTFFKPEAEAKGIKLAFRNSLPLKGALIQTDREKLYAILTNLVKNAIKYTEEGSIEFGYTVESGHALSLQFYVKDTGIGIPNDRQVAIFERFIQADIADKWAYQGAGLGLTISKAYVEMLGGEIWVESEEGLGSTFYFTLPYNTEKGDESVTNDCDTDDETKNNFKNLKILIADDDETSEMLIAINVDKFGKEILKARNGLEAVEVCRNNPDIDLILMDIQMPVMNGHEACRQIRQFNQNVVIIAQTAFGLFGDREKAIEAGCNDYISKPINKGKLLAIIQKFF